MKISVNCPSYKRPEIVKTVEYLPYAKIWVDCKEYEAYKKYYPKADIISCPEGIQGNLCRVRNYILKKEFERGMDVVLILDDDMTAIRRYDYDPITQFGYEPHVLSPDEFMVFLEKYSIMAFDIGAKFWGVNCNFDPMGYRHNTPFSTRTYIGGPFQCFLKGNRCWYDEQFYLKQDFDMTLQQLNLERVILRVNSYHYICNQSTNKGGCASYRNRDREKEIFDRLRRKWGGAIIREDFPNKGRTDKEKRMDYNPIMKVPIKGV